MSTATENSIARARGHAARGALAGFLLLAISASVVWSLTDGFSAWTAASRRTVAMYRGELRSTPLPVRDTSGRTEMLWSSGRVQLAYLVRFIDLSGPPSCLKSDLAFTRLQERLETLDRETPHPRVQLLTVVLAGDRPTRSPSSASLPSSKPISRWSSVATVHAASAVAALRASLDLPPGQGDLCIDDIHLIDALGRVRGLFASDRWRAAMQSAIWLAGRLTERTLQGP